MAAIGILLLYLLLKSQLPVGTFHLLLVIYSFFKGKLLVRRNALLLFYISLAAPHFSGWNHHILSVFTVIFPFIVYFSGPWNISPKWRALFARMIVAICLIEILRLLYFDLSIRRSFSERGMIFFPELGEMFSILFFVALYYWSRGYKSLFFGVFFITAIAVMKKNIIEFGFVLMRRRKFIFTLSLIAFASLGITYIDNIKENYIYLSNVGFEGHVRIGMYLIAFSLSQKYFPFGVGAGKFGSLMSTNPYSDLYYSTGADKLGLNAKEFLSIGQSTLLDTFWPGIIAEFGIPVTLILVVWIFTHLKKSIFPLNKLALGLFWLEGLVLFTPARPLVLLTVMVLFALNNRDEYEKIDTPRSTNNLYESR